MFRKVLLAGALCALALAIAVPPARASATDITALLGLHNTGVSGPTDGTTKDANYVYAFDSSSAVGAISALASPIGNPYITNANSWPIVSGPWLADGGLTNSNWISPQNSYAGNLSDPKGFYAYQTTFDVASYLDLSKITLSGQWSSDNNGVEILLNGNSYANVTPDTAFTSFHSFSIPSASNPGFIHGSNKLTFVVQNGSGGTGNPTGLRVGALSATTTQPIPEPAFFQLGTLLTCGGGLALFKKRSLA